MLRKIISGGQTGADRAALDFAIDHGIPHGGWCPAGRAAEDEAMSDDNKKAAANLRKLGERVRAGYAKLHPVSAKQLAAVRAAVAKQWEQEHAGKPMAKSQRSQSQSRLGHGQSVRQTRATKTKRRSQSHDYGHEY